MDEILYLEPDEEITSVIDKLKKSTGQSVGLVIPRNSSLVHSIVNLKLLKKEAEANEKEIALVTTDKIGKNIASQVGISVFEDVHAKRPANPLTSPDLPKGDEVIEVDMSNSAEAPASSEKSKAPKIKHYNLGSDDYKSSPKEPKSGIVDDEPPVQRSATDYASHGESAAHIKDERQVARSDSSRSSRRGRYLIIGLAALLIAAIVLLLPQTSILVTVAAEPFEKKIPVTVDGTAKEANTKDHILPGKLLEVSNDDAKRVMATGKKDVGDKATGTVSFANTWSSSSIDFDAGTVLTANGKNFSLKNKVTVPGATVAIVEGQLVTNAGKANADVVAAEPGDSYNIAPSKFTIQGLSGDKQAKITAESTKAFSGGFTKQVTIMTQSDVDGAKESLAADLTKTALDQIKKEAKDLKVIDDSAFKEVVSVETNPKQADSETDYFDIKVKLKTRAMAFDEKQLHIVVDKAVQQEVPSNKELISGEGDEFNIAVTGSDYANNKLVLETDVKTKVGTKVDPKAAKQGLAGKSETAVRSQLTGLPNVKDVAIYPFPKIWWQATSFFPWNTRLKVVYE